MPNTNQSGRFNPGQLIATPGVLDTIPRTELMNAFYRHLRCDWGDVCTEDKRRNDQALLGGGRLFSVYHSSEEHKFWIITEADRSATTILLPEEY